MLYTLKRCKTYKIIHKKYVQYKKGVDTFAIFYYFFWYNSGETCANQIWHVFLRFKRTTLTGLRSNSEGLFLCLFFLEEMT